MNFQKIFRYLHWGWRKNGIKGLTNLIKNYWVLKEEPEIIDAEILTAIIEPTIRCNLNCITCSESIRGRTKKDMGFLEFKRILDQFPYLIKLALQGVGEPLLNKDLLHMIHLAKEREIYVYFNSNGTILNDEISFHLIQSGLDLIHFSVDGGTKEVYEKIRRGASFEDFYQKVKRFMELKRDHPLPETHAWFVLNRYNENDLIPAAHFVKKMGIQQLYIQRMHRWGEEKKRDVESRGSGQELAEKKRAVEHLSKEIGLSVEWLWDIEGEEDSIRRCQAPWYTTYITAEGFVTPCCIHGSDPRLIHFGNIQEKPFKEIWNSMGYQEFRRALKSDHPPFICRGCPGYSQRILE